MLVSIGPRLLRCTSADGLNFTTDGTMLELGGSVSDTVKVKGGWRTFFHVNASPQTGGKMVIRSAFTADGATWKIEDGDRVAATANGPANLGVANPAPLRLADGSWLMALKSFIEPPRFARIGDGTRPRGDLAPGQPKQLRQPRQNDGPWNRDVLVWRVAPDGAGEKVATFERAGVPTIARMKDGPLIAAHQHFPADDAEAFDKVAVHFSADEGKTWDAAHVIAVDGLPEGMRFPFDPTLVPLPDGGVRLYFTGNMRAPRSVPAIHSAISEDGIRYTYEPGARFAVEGRPVIDCAVVLHGGTFHLYAPDNGANLGPPQPGEIRERAREGVGYHATSSDGLAFKRADDVRIEGRRRWLGNAQSDGKRITFYGTGEAMPAPGERPRGGLWMATSEDGAAWELVKSPAITGGDPGAVSTKDGGLIVVITGENVRSTQPPRRNH
jgi:hypothetical protein